MTLALKNEKISAETNVFAFLCLCFGKEVFKETENQVKASITSLLSGSLKRTYFMPAHN